LPSSTGTTGQHFADQIDLLLDAMDRDDFDLVVGSRFAPGGSTPQLSATRRTAMRTLSAVLRRSGGVSVSDPTSGFRAIRGPLLMAFSRDFPPYYLGDTFEALLVAGRRGYRIGEVGVAMQSRQGGTPSADLIASIRSMIRALTVLFTGTSFDIAPAPSTA
jgi:hypothetical protein